MFASLKEGVVPHVAGWPRHYGPMALWQRTPAMLALAVARGH
jgi:hypothetical protein